MRITLTKECILTIHNPECYVDGYSMGETRATIYACFGTDEEDLFSTLDVKYVTTVLGDKIFRMVTEVLTDDDKERLLGLGRTVINTINIEHVVETYEYDSDPKRTKTKEYDRIVVTDFTKEV